MVVLLLGLAVRLFSVAVETELPSGTKGDPARFAFQAEQLVAGHGLVSFHAARSSDFRSLEPTAALPPGYPVFIALVLQAGANLTAVLWLQLALSLISCALVYLALRPVDVRLATLALLIMALTPGLYAYPAKLMSETLGVFLGAVQVYLLLRVYRGGRGLLTHGLLGAVAIANVLVVPGVLFVASLPCLVVAFSGLRRQPAAVLMLLVGGVLVMAPWQRHCVAAAGHLCWKVLDTELGEDGYTKWKRTWARSSADFSYASNLVWWDSEWATVDGLPEYAFGSARERRQLAEKIEYWRANRVSQAERSEYLGALAEARIRSAPVAFYVTNPLRRMADMIVNFPPTRYARSDALLAVFDPAFWREAPTWSSKHLAKQILRILTSWLALFAHLALLAAIGVGFWFAVVGRSPIGLSLALGFLLFLIVNAGWASIDLRRVLPLIPYLLAIGAFGPRSVAQTVVAALSFPPTRPFTKAANLMLRRPSMRFSGIDRIRNYQ